MTSIKSKKKVLVFIDWFLPGNKAGGPIRSVANLIDHFVTEFDFSIITRDTDYTESKPYSGINSDAWNVLPDGKRVYYISAGQLNKNTIAQLLRDEKYDAVYLNGIWSQAFTAWPMKELKRSKFKGEVIVAARGMLAPSALAIKATKKKLYLHLAKWRNDFSNVIFHATDLKEASDIRNAIGDKTEILVAGNLPRMIATTFQHAAKKPKELRIISVARISPEKNTLYAIEVLSKVKNQLSADFYGPIYSEEYWLECKAAAEKLPANINLNFLGAIAADEISKTLANYDLLFMPTRGENFGHIILESLQSGTPVLISDQTPWKNLVKENAGWDLPLQSQDAFVKFIESISGMNESEFRIWSEGAIRFSKQYASNEKLIVDNRKLFS
ncbi:MAG: glycosyltransferase family 4 protein [Bacteroidetes bacterium]|nr:glycosyltransferase family 4 protein [Bacteroidota bacterium]